MPASLTEDSWRDALVPNREGPSAPPDFALSESPRYVGRAVAALAADADRGRWNQQSVTSGRLASIYGFTDVDGSQPDVWRFMEALGEGGSEADYAAYR